MRTYGRTNEPTFFSMGADDTADMSVILKDLFKGQR